MACLSRSPTTSILQSQDAVPDLQHANIELTYSAVQSVSGDVWKASLQAEQRGMRDKVSNVVQAAFSALSLQCTLAPQREPREAAAVAELMTPVLLEKVCITFCPRLTAVDQEHGLLSLGAMGHVWPAIHDSQVACGFMQM